MNRAAKALAFLGGPWATYVDARTHAVRWADVIIAGHSNGADHAGYVSKKFNVSWAVLFAGPNDAVDVWVHARRVLHVVPARPRQVAMPLLLARRHPASRTLPAKYQACMQGHCHMQAVASLWFGSMLPGLH